MCFAQTKGDSLRQIWENETLADTSRYKAISNYYQTNSFSQPDSVLPIIEYHYKLAESKNSVREIIRALREKAKILYIKGKPDESMLVLKQVEILTPQVNDLYLVASNFANMGLLYQKKQQYKEAIQYYSSCLKICLENGFIKDQIVTLHNLASVHHSIGNNDISLEYAEKALAKSKETENEIVLGHIWLNISDVKYEQTRYQESIRFATKALNRFKSENDRFSESDSYFNLAEAYGKLGNRDSAYFYVDNCLKIDEEIKNETKLFLRKVFRANLTFDTDVKEATRKGEELLATLKPSISNEIKESLYKLLFKCYKAQGKLDLSIEMLELSNTYNDSVQLEKNNFALTREAVKNEYDIQLLENKLENEKAQSDLKITQLKSMFITISVALLIILLIILFFRSIIKKNLRKRELLLARCN